MSYLRRWYPIPGIVIVWALIAGMNALYAIRLSTEQFVLASLVCLVATGILGGYLLGSGWSVIVVPLAIYAGLTFPTILFDKPLDFSWDSFFVLSALFLVVLFLTSGVPALLTVILTRRKVVSTSAHVLSPLVVSFTLVAYLVGYFTLDPVPGLWFQLGALFLACAALALGTFVAFWSASDVISRYIGAIGVVFSLPVLLVALISFL